MENQLEDYNMEPGVISMDLVLFKDAIEHGKYLAQAYELRCLRDRHTTPYYVVGLKACLYDPIRVQCLSFINFVCKCLICFEVFNFLT